MQTIHTKEVIVIFSHDPSVSVSDHLNSELPVSAIYALITAVVANISYIFGLPLQKNEESLENKNINEIYFARISHFANF